MIMKLDLEVSLGEYNAATTEPLDVFIARKQRELEIKHRPEEQKKNIQTRGIRRLLAKFPKFF